MNLVMATLNSGGNDGGFRTEPGEHIIAFDPTASLDQAPNDRTSPPLKVGTGLGIPWAPAVLTAGTIKQRQITSGGGKPGQGYPAAMVGSAIRRLTPLECERLQGFPDGHTCLCGASDEWRTALRVVCENAYARNLPIGTEGELLCHAEASLLRLVLRSPIPSDARGLREGWGAQAGAAFIHGQALSPLWFDFLPDATSQGWQYAQQFARELGSLVPLMPYEGRVVAGHLCESGRCVVGAHPRSHEWEIRRLPDEISLMCRCPNSPRYRAMGNAVTVNVIEWLGRRLRVEGR